MSITSSTPGSQEADGIRDRMSRRRNIPPTLGQDTCDKLLNGKLFGLLSADRVGRHHTAVAPVAVMQIRTFMKHLGGTVPSRQIFAAHTKTGLCVLFSDLCKSQRAPTVGAEGVAVTAGSWPARCLPYFLARRQQNTDRATNGRQKNGNTTGHE